MSANYRDRRWAMERDHAHHCIDLSYCDGSQLKKIVIRNSRDLDISRLNAPHLAEIEIDWCPS